MSSFQERLVDLESRLKDFEIEIRIAKLGCMTGAEAFRDGFTFDENLWPAGKEHFEWANQWAKEHALAEAETHKDDMR